MKFLRRSLVKILLLILCVWATALWAAEATIPKSNQLPVRVTDSNETAVYIGDATNNAVRVNVVAGGAGDGKILDGTAAGEADVIGSAPGGTEQGLVVRNIPSGTQPVSGTFWQATQPVSGTFWQTTQPVSAATLPLPSGASTSALQGGGLPAALGAGGGLKVDGSGTALPISGTVTSNAGTNLNTSALLTTTAHDAAFGTAGAADAQVRTVQGVASMTPLLVDGSAVTQPTNVSQIGGTAVVASRCLREEPTYITINQTANAQLATGVAAERIYICSFNFVTATAQNVALVSGTGTTCGTSTSGVTGFGGATAATGYNLAANGGIVLPGSANPYGQTDTNADNLCLFQSGVGQVSGGLTYVSQ